MRVLADSEIRRLLDSGDLVIDPLPEDGSIQPVSVDLRLGKAYAQKPGLDCIRLQEPFKEDDYIDEVEFGDDMVIAPGDYRLLETIERLRMPEGISGIAVQRSRMGRALVEGAGFGFSGSDYSMMRRSRMPEHVRYAFRPHAGTKLLRGDRICQVVMFDMDGDGPISPDEAVSGGYLDVSEETMRCGMCGSMVMFAGDVYAPKDGVTLSPGSGVDVDGCFDRVDDDVLPPGRAYLVRSRERFRFTEKVAGIVEGTMCQHLWHNQSLMHSCFAGLVDPGYEGNLMMQVYSNWGPIDRSKPMAIVTLYPVKGAVERVYGSKSLNSNHQGKF
ncbi:MAG: hypothetical protein DRO99_02205 [Candidatus Aenigmatarchaeota archaeon]|nr:MAG: hypothetical protein DRO99_02205 [Candidatus Aenigmarchaeota archaeon]